MSKLITNIKVIYSLEIRNILAVQGFDYLREIDNFKKPGFKCWIYEATPEFLDIYDQILTERGCVKNDGKRK